MWGFPQLLCISHEEKHRHTVLCAIYIASYTYWKTHMCFLLVTGTEKTRKKKKSPINSRMRSRRPNPGSSVNVVAVVESVKQHGSRYRQVSCVGYRLWVVLPPRLSVSEVNRSQIWSLGTVCVYAVSWHNVRRCWSLFRYLSVFGWRLISGNDGYMIKDYRWSLSKRLSWCQSSHKSPSCRGFRVRMGFRGETSRWETKFTWVQTSS